MLKALTNHGNALASSTAKIVSSQVSSSSCACGSAQGAAGSMRVASGLIMPRSVWRELRGDRGGGGLEGILVEQRLRTHQLTVRLGEVLHVQRRDARLQHLVMTQHRRVADHIDAVVLEIDQRIVGGGTGLLRLAEY